MPDNNEGTQGTETGTENQTANNTATTPPEGNDPVDWQAVAERNAHFMRENEKKLNAARKELDDIRAANMTDAEKAIAEATSAGEKAGYSKAAEKLVKTEMKAAAALAGVEIPTGLDRIVKFDSLLNSDGEPDEEAIKTLVSSFKPSNGNRTAFAQGLGIGQTGGGEAVIDYSPQAIADRVFKRTSY